MDVSETRFFVRCSVFCEKHTRCLFFEMGLGGVPGGVLPRCVCVCVRALDARDLRDFSLNLYNNRACMCVRALDARRFC